MSKTLYRAVDDCLRALDDGASLEHCIRSHPRQAEELRPILEAALAARELPEPIDQANAMIRSHNRLAASAARLRAAVPERRAWRRIPRLAVIVSMVLGLFIFTSGSLAVVSAQSLPGDTFYPVKRAVESLRVELAVGAEQAKEIEMGFQQQRINEVHQLLAMQHQQKISFEGIVERISPDTWVVGGVQTRLTSATVIIGEISPGLLVEVEGLTEAEGCVSASEIHLMEYQLTGVVEDIGSYAWIVSGQVLKITAQTQITPGIKPGDRVMVLVRNSDSDDLGAARAILFLVAQENSSPPAGIFEQSEAGLSEEIVDEALFDDTSTEATQAEGSDEELDQEGDPSTSQADDESTESDEAEPDPDADDEPDDEPEINSDEAEDGDEDGEKEEESPTQDTD